MFSTPPLRKMVQTRSALKKDEEGHQAAAQKPNQEAQSEILAPRKPVKKQFEGSVKTEPLPQKPTKPTMSTKVSNTSSVAARRKLLELKAAEEKAKIEMALIDARLEADIAVLEEESRAGGSRQSVNSIRATNSRVKEWLNQSALAGELAGEPEKDIEIMNVTYNNKKSATHRPQKTSCSNGNCSQHCDEGEDGVSVQSKKTEVVQKTNLNPDVCFGELLSRLATSKDLPMYYGDPLEWMQFKQAYEQSTVMCNYNDTENMWRLRKCLKGDAKEAVTSLLMGQSSPVDVIRTLELQFGRPENIINKVVSQIKKLPPLHQAYHTQIVSFAVKIKNCTTTARSTDPTYLNSPELVNTIMLKLPSTLLNKWSDYVFEHQSLQKPKMELMSEFLFLEATKTASAGISHININTSNESTSTYKKKFTPHFQALTVATEIKCKFCRKHDHALSECKIFKRAMKRDRWRFVKTQRLCYQCLQSSHNKDSCSAPHCGECGQPHHSLLHWKTPSKAPVKSHNDDTQNTDAEEVVTNINAPMSHSIVLLKIVHVYIDCPEGSLLTHALLDDGASCSLISADLAERAGLHGQPQTIRLRGAFQNTEIMSQCEIVDISLSSSDGNKFKIQARKMKELQLPTQSYVDTSKYTHLRDLQDCLYCGHSEFKPQLLIGQDNYHLLAPMEIIMGNKNQPHATRSPLGWSVHGTVCTYVSSCNKGSTPEPGERAAAAVAARAQANRPTSDVMTGDVFHVGSYCDESAQITLHEQVRRYFEFESIGVSLKPRENKLEQKAVSILNNTIKLLDNNQWEVGLPWKNENMIFEDSYPSAAKRLRNIERKMISDKEYGERYRERVQHLLQNNYARKITNKETPTREWFLPHFGVDNPKKKKLRLVFDAAAKTNGLSLNDYLLQGPDLLQSLLAIMFRFREKPIGITGDIKDMFLRIKIRPEDQHALMFLWRDQNNAQPISESKYVMTSLIFGSNCSPFIAQYVKNHNAHRFQKEMPVAVEAIYSSHYMDDYIQSHETENIAIKTIQEIEYIHKQGGFHIRNWISNNNNVLKVMPESTLCNNVIWTTQKNHSERVLGMLWFPSTDTFAFDLSLENIPTDILNMRKQPTKREVLKITASIYDIYGILSPFLITAKIILQEIWKTNIGWDDLIPTPLYESFKDWLAQLKNINELRIPRWYFRLAVEGTDSLEESKLQLHVFCDASPSAYAAVAYWRRLRNDDVCVALIASKSRVAPIKPTSVPRLELQAALLGCRLADTILKEHTLNIHEKYFWTDSSTVLHWIKNDCRTYKSFIANRLGEIDSLSKIDEWRFVPTSLNIADASTKKNNYTLNNDCEWLRGPAFLQLDPTNWPTTTKIPETEKIDENILEKIHIICLTKENNDRLPIPDPNRFSSWLKLLRATAAMLSFINRCRKIQPAVIDCTLINKAEMLLMRQVQLDAFKHEITCLEKNKCIERNSKLLPLTPFMDSDQLLRVGGRINAAPDTSIDVKTPVILDGHHHITRLLVKYYHEKAAHANNEMVVNQLRQRYWVTRLRPTVRSVATKCLTCRLKKAKPQPPRMGDLPAARLAHHQRPFACTGVDLFGPMDITVGRRHEKRYGVLFTCLTVRAIHIELVTSLTTDSMIMAIRRMAARRGWPKHLYSDNGTNLRGANNEINKCKTEIDETVLKQYGVNNEMEWHFISPLSPHMGGAWERMIRSVKTALKVVLKERAPKEEVLLTLLAEVENLINSRPLTHVSVDPTSEDALTPNHFLLGSPSSLPILGEFKDSDLYLRKYWRTAQQLTDMFWRRWLREVLPALLPRSKWNQEGIQLRAGDLVFIMDPANPRNTWPRGRVEKTYPGQDGRVRVADVKTKTGTLTRPVTRLVPLPTSDECCKDSTRGEDVADTYSDI